MMTTTSQPHPPTAAVHTEDLTKVYGRADARVVALDRVTVHRDHGTVRLGQVDAHALRRRS